MRFRFALLISAAPFFAACDALPCLDGPTLCAAQDSRPHREDITALLSRPELSPTDEIFFARTLYGEARDQSTLELEAIAHVIYTRWHSGKYGTTITDVVLYSRGGNFAFSCWKPGTAVFKGMMRADTAALGPYREIARRIFDQRTTHLETNGTTDNPDITNGATHYYHPAAMKPAYRLPVWAQSKALRDPTNAPKIVARLMAGEDPARVLPPPYTSRIEIGDAVFMTIPKIK